MWGQSLGRGDPLEEKMATHSSILAEEIPWTEEPGRLQPPGWQSVRYNSVIKQQLVQELATHSSTPAWKIPCMEELQRLGHDWATSLSFYSSFWRRKWQRGLVGYSLWGCKELNTTKQLTHTHTHTHRVQYDLILTLLHLQRPYFQIRSFHKYGGLGLEHIFLVDIAQLTTLGMTWSKSGVRVISEKGNMAGDEKVFWGNNQSFLLTWLWGMKTRWRQFWALCVCKWEKKKTCILLGKCLITLAGAGAEVCKFHERKCHTITGKNKFDSLYWILFFFSNFNLYILLLLLQVKNLYL